LRINHGHSRESVGEGYGFVGHRVYRKVVPNGGIGRGVLQYRGRYTNLRPLVRALEESCARLAEREGKEVWRRAVAGVTLGWE